ncbi:MAG: 4'-phosphopantetheinyl transferase family protein [bacterium]
MIRRVGDDAPRIADDSFPPHADSIRRVGDDASRDVDDSFSPDIDSIRAVGVDAPHVADDSFPPNTDSIRGVGADDSFLPNTDPIRAIDDDALHVADDSFVPDTDSIHAVGAITPRWTPRAIAADDAPPLAPGQVHLWAIDLARLSMQPDGHHLSLLTASERARGERLRDGAPRTMYLGGRAGLRLLLRAYAGVPNDRLRFGVGAHGKPSLRNRLRDGELCFNYSLSRGHALYAVAWNRQVGIDLEASPRNINAARLAKRKLTAAERRAWREVPARWRERAMLACWTRKEAYGKALGVGIRYHINRAPLCVELAAPTWASRARGLFDADAPMLRGRVLHGVQLTPPFAGIAALVHDGAALDAPDDGVSLQSWQWRESDLQ